MKDDMEHGYDQRFKLVEGEIPENAARAYLLTDGVVFSINGHIIQFENKLFYEVVEVEYEEIIEGIKVKTIAYQRTGKKYAMEELQNLPEKGCK